MGYFSLDEVSGVLRLERPLTPEAPDLFRLAVRASDRGLPRHRHADAAVEVKVVSLHDFLPTFVTLEHSVQVPESLQVGAEVLNMELLLHEHITPLVKIHLVEADGPFDYHRASGECCKKRKKCLRGHVRGCCCSSSSLYLFIPLAQCQSV